MSQESSPSPEQLLAELKSKRQSVLLSTIGEQGDPHSGYTPFIENDGDVLVFVSQLALHTRDMLSDPRVSVMMIDDESDTSQIFARTRATYQCRAKRIHREDEHYEPLLKQFQARHGKMISLLRQLPDFVLFRLSPHQGRFVMGFGKAYELTGENFDQFEQVTSA